MFLSLIGKACNSWTSLGPFSTKETNVKEQMQEDYTKQSYCICPSSTCRAQQQDPLPPTRSTSLHLSRHYYSRTNVLRVQTTKHHITTTKRNAPAGFGSAFC
ncbi:hypothetical protein FKM82_005447 [Ascaphus truei]